MGVLNRINSFANKHLIKERAIIYGFLQKNRIGLLWQKRT